MRVLPWTVVAGGLLISAIPAAHAADAAAGKEIFSEICSHCHNSTSNEKIGPGLAGITERRSVEWINAWLQDPAELVKTDEYARKLRQSNKYGMTMPTMPIMKNDQKRADVIEYLKTLQ